MMMGIVTDSGNHDVGTVGQTAVFMMLETVRRTAIIMIFWIISDSGNHDFEDSQ